MKMFCNPTIIPCATAICDMHPTLPARCFVWWIPRPRTVCPPGHDTHVLVSRRDLEVFFELTQPKTRDALVHPAVRRIFNAAGFDLIKPEDKEGDA